MPLTKENAFNAYINLFDLLTTRQRIKLIKLAQDQLEANRK